MGLSLLHCLYPTSTHSNDKPVLARAPSSIHKDSEKTRIKIGVRQGDTIPPKLFMATMESILIWHHLFRRLNWENKCMKIDEGFLNILRHNAIPRNTKITTTEFATI